MTIGSGQVAPRPWLVTIEHKVTTTGGSGAPVTSWQPLLTVYMAREAMTGDERFIVSQISARQYHQWSMPFDQAMDPDTVDVPATRRLVFEGRQYDIVRGRRVGDLGASIELVTLSSTEATA